MNALRRRLPSSVSLQAAGHLAICGIIGLAFLLGFFARVEINDLPYLRLAETRMNFFTHLFCQLALLATLWINAREQRPFFRLGILPALVFLVYLGASAGSSPIPAAAFEDWMFWLDAVMFFYVGQMLVARRPDLFFLLFAILGNVIGIFAIGAALSNPRHIPPEYILAVCGALSMAAVLVVTGRQDPEQQRSFLRFMALLAFFAFMAFLLSQFSPGPAGAPESVAMRHILELRPLTGCGIGCLPDILPSFAPQDYDALPLPPNTFVILRAEIGWLGLACLAVVILLPVIRLFAIFHEYNGNGTSFFAFGLACTILLIVIGGLWHAFLAIPFGRFFLFLLLGVAASYGIPEAEMAAAQSRRRWEPGMAIPALALVALVWLSYQQMRPYRAARLQARAFQHSPDEELLRRGTQIYPHDAALWDARAAAARAAFKADPWRESSFQNIVNLYHQSLRLNPYRFKTYASLASVYELAKRPYSAETTLRKGLSYIPRNETLRRWLIKVLNEKGNYSGALQEMERLVHDLPVATKGKDKNADSRTEMHLRIAQAYQKRGNAVRAASHSAMALLENPHSTAAKKAMAAFSLIQQPESRPTEP